MAVSSAARYLPILDWGRTYDRHVLTSDLLAAVIVTIMLIPQSLAYALLAGLPPEAGLYASILPILLYTVFGTSRVLAVGPVAVVSLMTAAAISQVAEAGTAGYAIAALTLACLSGGMLLLMGLLRLGFLANFLSHPVISGFISASGILIAASQIGPLTGLKAEGHSLFQQLVSLGTQVGQISPPTLAIGLCSLGFLFWVRRGFKPLLRRAGLSPRPADMLAKAGPVAAIAVSAVTVWWLGLDRSGVAVVGAVPQSLPPFTLPSFDMTLIKTLVLPAGLISLIGFVESVSVGQTLAAKRRQRIDPDQELVALGAANLGASMTGGFPVTGGFARSVVNYDAGAATPAAGAFTAIGLALAALFLTPLIHFLPKATLAATIVVAVLSLVDLSILRRSWAYSRADFAAVAATMSVTLLVGVEAGVSAGVVLSLVLHLYRTSRPHVAEVGLVPKTEHFRNIHRFQVETDPTVLTLRIDESLYFANTRYLEDLILKRVSGDTTLRHVILMCSAVNEIDLSALETLETLDHRLRDMGVTLHLSEVKGPVMDRLRKSQFLQQLSGEVYVSQFEGWCKLTGRCTVQDMGHNARSPAR
ncbi:MAG: sulfate permease [Pseudomonadota bacterium]|jgi:SulP family sulfate permease